MDPITLSLIIAAVEIGVGIGLMLLFPAELSGAEQAKIPVESSVAPRTFIYGETRIAGALMLRETNPGGDNLATVLACAAHRVDSFRNIFLNDDVCEFWNGAHVDHGNTPTSDGDFVKAQADGRYGGDKLPMAIRLGLDPETPMAFISTYGIPSATWQTAALGGAVTHNARGDTCAQIGLVCIDAGADEQQKRYPYGAPEPSAVIRGYRTFDPRPVAGQDPDDPTTWTWSDNPARAILHWLCHSEFGYRYRYDEAILPVVDQWADEVGICNEAINTWLSEGVSGPDIDRYNLGGWGDTNATPKETLEKMLQACDGWLARRGDGTCILRVGKFRDMGVEIGSEDILAYAYQKGQDDDRVINQLNVQFTMVENLYTQIECDPWTDNADVASRGFIRDDTINYEWVLDFRQARRLAKREFVRRREPLRGTFELRLSAINAAYERWIHIVSEIPGLTDLWIENLGARWELSSSPPRIVMQWQRIDPTALEDWAPLVDADDDGISDDEGRKPPVVPRVGILPIPDVGGLVITKITLSGSNALRFTWDKESYTTSKPPRHDIRYRLEGSSDTYVIELHAEVPKDDPVNPTTRWFVNSAVVPGGGTVNWEGAVRARYSAGSVGEWSNTDVTST